MKLICTQFALSLLLAVMSITMAQAVTPVGKQVTGTIALQGGSNSAVKYMAPSTAPYKVHVLVPKTGKTTNALYRVYPKGKRTGSTGCLSSDATFPCYEITVDQTQHQNAWVQLVLDNDAATQWDFVKGKGYVTALAGNLSAVEMLNLSAVVRFVNPSLSVSLPRYGLAAGGAIVDEAFVLALPLTGDASATNLLHIVNPTSGQFGYMASPVSLGLLQHRPSDAAGSALGLGWGGSWDGLNDNGAMQAFVYSQVYGGDVPAIVQVAGVDWYVYKTTISMQSLATEYWLVNTLS